MNMLKMKVIPTDFGSPPQKHRELHQIRHQVLQASSETKYYQKKGGKEEQKHQPLWQPEKKCWILMMSRNSSDETWDIIGVANWFFKTVNQIWIL